MFLARLSSSLVTYASIVRGHSGTKGDDGMGAGAGKGEAISIASNMIVVPYVQKT